MKRFEVFLIILILIAGSYSVIYYHDHENSKIIDDGDMEFESKTVHEKFQRRSKELRIDLIRNHQKISDTVGGFIGILDNVDFFGWSVSNIGDLNNDGISDLCVGAPNDDDGGRSRGAVWILFSNRNGTVKKY
jgi:hypothetical protein